MHTQVARVRVVTVLEVVGQFASALSVTSRVSALKKRKKLITAMTVTEVDAEIMAFLEAPVRTAV